MSRKDIKFAEHSGATYMVCGALFVPLVFKMWALGSQTYQFWYLAAECRLKLYKQQAEGNRNSGHVAFAGLAVPS